jgi:outer membrane receptor protein involved in Fe transport
MPANRTTLLLRAITVTSALGFASMPQTAGAQAAPAPDTTTTTTTTTAATTTTTTTDQTPPPEAPMVLSPFVVDASEDAGSYQATSTLAGTRVRTDLKDVASAISVVTAQFLQDTGAKNQEDLLIYTPSTEVTGLRGNFSGVAGTAISEENTVDSTTRVRGLDSADNTRDYFISDIPWDAFDVGRVDLQRGPNSILFGTGSPAGIINVSTSGASFTNSYNITNRIDEYGSLRDSVSINQQLVPGVFAIHLAALQDDEKYEQVPAFSNQTRYYGAFRFDPKLFGKDSHTSIRGDYEWGKQTSDNPRIIPPEDEITPWFTSSITTGGVTNPGLDKTTINEYAGATTANPTGQLLPPGAFEQIFGGQGREGWADVTNYYEATPANLNNVPNPANPTGTPIYATASEQNYGFVAANPSIGQEGAYLTQGTFANYAVEPFSTYAGFVGSVAPTSSGSVPPNYAYPVTAIPGGGYYTDKYLTDPSIFNFYKLLLDGPNKSEWKSWKAFNLTLDQTFFDDRIGIEVAYDQQSYTEGSVPFLQGQEYGITVNVNDTYPDGTQNPNVGRPEVAAGTGEEIDYQTTTTRQTFRVTPTGELRSSDFFSNPTLTWLLGKSDLTALYEKTQVVTFNYDYATYALSPQWDTDNWSPTNAGGYESDALGSWNQFDFVAFLGPSLLNASSAANAHLNNINYIIAPPAQEVVQNFNSTWNVPTDPNAPGYVNPAAPYTFVNIANGVGGQTGNTEVTTQSENPANYVGWQQHTVYYYNADDPSEFPSLVTNAQRTRYTDSSEGITWQGYLLGGDLVPSLGWRKDRVVNYQSNAYTDPISGFTSLNFPDNLASRTDVVGVSKTWGGVYHFPKALMSKLPGDVTFSVLLDRSENFKPDASRLSLAGLPVPNASGTTTEAGFVITALSDKVSLKVDWFKTIVKNATLEGTNGNSIAGLGGNGYVIPDNTVWGYGWAAALQDGLEGKTPNTNYWNYAAASGYAPGSAQFIATQAYSQQIVNAWVNLPVPDSFFASYNVTPAIVPSLAKASGQLDSAFLAGYDDATAPNLGGGSQFGDHVTTVDNLSKGVEVEFTTQILRNWNVTLNYTHVDSTHEDIDPAAQAFISQLTGFYNGPGGAIRMWCNVCGSTVGQNWNENIVAPFTVELNDQGHAAPEVAPWRLNLVSTYTFDRGPIKGVFIGGALRMEAARILGYAYSPTFKNVNSTDPNYANVLLVTEGGLDVNEPFMGPTDTHVDMWIGYQRKLFASVNWRIQLNMQNVGEKDSLVPAQYEPDGSLALARIQEGMGFRLENSFDF